MPITLITGPANAGKARAVLELLREHCARGAAPLLVVPTRADVERYSRELAEAGLLHAGEPAPDGEPAGGGEHAGSGERAGSGELAGSGESAGSGEPAGSGESVGGGEPAGRARVERFEGLLAEIVRRAGGAQRPLGALARERVLATLAGSATRGVVRALAAFVGELEVERVSVPRLRAALAAWAAVDPAHAARARRLGAVYEEYERVLAGLGRADPELRATRALDALRRTPARWGGRPVLLYGFDDFTRLQLDAIETLGVVVGARVTVSLAFERGRTAFAGRAGTFQTLLPLAGAHRELGARAEYYAPAARGALHHLERFLFEPERPVGVPRQVAAGDAVRLLEGGGERAELELVAEQIVGLLERGFAGAEIAVVHRTPGAIGELLGEVFAAYGIAYVWERRLRFADTAMGGALLGALATACEADQAELGQLLAWLRAPGVLAEPEQADALEARARRAGVSSAAQGRALWEAQGWPAEPLHRVDSLREVPGASGVPANANGVRADASGVPAAASDERTAAGGMSTDADALIGRAARELERLGEAWAAEFAAERVGQDTLAVERRALEVGRAALAELGELALAAPELAADGRALLAALRGLELVIGQPASAGVAVLDPLALRARRVRALFVCGLQEGVFPAPARAEPLFSEEERRQLVEASGLLALAGTRRAADALAAERYLLYAAVSRPEELLVLSWHTADDDGVARARSLFVDDVCDLFTCDLHGVRSRRALGEVGEGRGSLVASRGVSPARTALGSSVDWPAAGAPGEQLSLELAAAVEPSGEQLGGRAAALAEPLGERLAPLGDARVLAELRERRLWSASSLEVWAGCPARWFVERLLGARNLEPEPEPLARGGLAHAALRDVLAGLRAETGSARLRPEVLRRARELLRAALAEREREYPLSVAAERVPGVRRRLQADLERYLEHAAEEASALEPTYLELPFGFPDEQEGLPALELGEGVRVRGRIDRVDVDRAGGEAVVYDYKSSRALDVGKWARERSFQAALYMRAVESLPGVRAVGGFYQPLAGRDLRARGVLDAEAGVELAGVRGDVRERAELQELAAAAVAAAREAAMQARAGALEARPGTCGFGDGACMYPAICRCER